ncbi:SRR1-like protein [Plasmodium sp. gorilla clade G2]|uniref:SRR1-like protein n=1 Tax=Plasmodium sp. gorilla clade G2 TaxID=880535 RepID=UPI000D2253EB|nr:SRR1-like protein [Plasmodium sp. gorilla clade G2]SOV10579.1 SRR1-like protein [Plasmodium sp. gorilla clade G2]
MDEWIVVQKKKSDRHKNQVIDKLTLKNEKKQKEKKNDNAENNIYEEKENIKIQTIYNIKKKVNVKNICKNIENVTCDLEKNEFFKNFKNKFNTINKENVNKAIISLGLGSLIDINLNNKKACIYQFAFLVLLKKVYDIKQVYIYDPKISEVDRYVCEYFNIKILICSNEEEHKNDEEDNKSGDNKENNNNIDDNNNNNNNIDNYSDHNYIHTLKHKQNSKDTHIANDVSLPCTEKMNIIKFSSNIEKVILFMPHCDIHLYGDILYSIFVNEKLFYKNVQFYFNLENTIFLGNSFDYYKDHSYLYKPFGLPSYVIKMLNGNCQKLNISIQENHMNKLLTHFKTYHFIFYILNFVHETKFPIFSDHVGSFNDLSITIFHKIEDKLKFWSHIYESLNNM